MPSLQQTSNFKDCTSNLTGSDILQKHSINSLLEHNEMIMPTEVESNNLTFAELFGNLTTSTPMKGSHQSGFNSHGNNSSFTQTAQSKSSFENFQFDNRSLQRNLSYDCNVTTPTTPSTPGSSKAFQNSPPYGTESISRSSYESSSFYNMSRSNSPVNDSHDMNSPSFENRSLVDLMNILQLNQPSPLESHHRQQQQEQHPQAYHYSQEELKQLQAFQTFQMQLKMQQQLNAAPIQQILQQQLLNRYNSQAQQQLQQQNWRQPSTNGNSGSLDHAAKYHRSSAALYDASCTWSGVLPPRSHRFITYSPKVFLGGIPWDISEQTLMQILKPFGQIRIEWPGKEQNAAQPKGYV